VTFKAIDLEEMFPVGGGVVELRLPYRIDISAIPKEHQTGAVRGCSQCRHQGWYTSARVGKMRCELFSESLTVEKVGKHVYVVPCKQCQEAHRAAIRAKVKP